LLDRSDSRIALTKVIGGGPQTVAINQLGPDHRILTFAGLPFTYHVDGHRATDGEHAFDVDALGRIVRVHALDGTTLAEFGYDALSRLANGAINGESFSRSFAGDRWIEEARGANGSIRQASQHPLWEQSLCITEQASTFYVHSNAGLSTSCVVDSLGTVREKHRYGPFGIPEVLDGDGNLQIGPMAAAVEPHWRGMAFVAGLGLYLTPQRAYDPKCGVFLARDPLLFRDSASPYAYACHNPVDFSDSTGWDKSRANQADQWVKETVIDASEVDFYSSRDKPPSEPDHRFGYYPIRKIDERLGKRFGSAWLYLKTSMPAIQVLANADEFNPYNIPDHFLSAGRYARRWIWFDRRGQTAAGLMELLNGHGEAVALVGAAELGLAGLKGGVSAARSVDWAGLHNDQRGAIAIPFSGSASPPSVDPQGFRRGGNAYKAVLGVERTSLELLAEDPLHVSMGRELSFDALLPDGTTVGVRFDELFMTPEGSLLNAESKFGQHAGFTMNERMAGVPQETSIRAIPTAATAERTGLPAGQVVQIQTRVFRWLWEGVSK
jgi:RHS repeat-associated protein